MSWDGFQREMLAELGLAAYALAGVQAAVTALETTLPQPAADTSAPLLRALLRAAAADAAHTDALALCRAFLAAHPQPTAQARRALWPQLRRLRSRQHA